MDETLLQGNEMSLPNESLFWSQRYKRESHSSEKAFREPHIVRDIKNKEEKYIFKEIYIAIY